MSSTFAFLFVSSLLAAGPADEDGPIPVPNVAELDKSIKLVREIFKSEYTRTTPKAKQELAAELFKQGEELRDDPPGQFALLLEAADIAGQAGDADLGLRAIEQLLARFVNVKHDRIEPILKNLASRAASAESNQILTDFLVKLSDSAVVVEDHDTADRLLAIAASTASKTKAVRTVAQVAAKRKDLEELRRQIAEVKVALAKLAATPNDPDASTIVGKYFCFLKGDWETGLKLLEAGSDLRLKAAARKDREGPNTADELLTLADAWYDIAIASVGSAKKLIATRASGYYLKALPDLAGLNKVRAEKRLEEIAELGGGSPHDELFLAVHSAIRNKQTEDLPPGGGFINKKEYREVVPGGVLIGFQYTTKLHSGAHLIMDYLQPIYMTSSGEKLGAVYGKKPARFEIVKAKPGYAVGGFKIRGGGLFEGFSIVFMKIQGKALNTGDNYESAWMGRDRSTGHPVLSDGRPIIGIHGKLRADEDGDEEICTIGPIVAGAKK